MVRNPWSQAKSVGQLVGPEVSGVDSPEEQKGEWKTYQLPIFDPAVVELCSTPPAL